MVSGVSNHSPIGQRRSHKKSTLPTTQIRNTNGTKIPQLQTSYDLEDDQSKSPFHKRSKSPLQVNRIGFIVMFLKLRHNAKLFLLKIRSSKFRKIQIWVFFFLLALCLFGLMSNDTPSMMHRQVVRQIHLNAKPRVMGYMYDSISTDIGHKTGNLFRMRIGPRRKVFWEKPENGKKQRQVEKWEEGDCVAMDSWQKSSFPTCQKLHEIDIQGDLAEQGTRRLNNGFFRDVWVTRDDEISKGVDDRRILKTMRWKHEFNHMNYDRHRRDAVAMERLTASPYVLDIYGFCGNSGIFEFGDGGDISDVVWPEDEKVEPLTSIDKLKIATQVAMGITATHNVEHPGVAAMAHTDISPDQFIMVDGFYKLNDFNRVRFIRKNKKTGESCPYRVGNNPGEFRSPEEYRYEDQTEKVDVYSMGNVIYFILTRKWPFEDNDEDDAEKQKMVIAGERPPVKPSIRNSEDPAIKALLKAMNMCQKDDIKERASAEQIVDFLSNELNKLSS